MLRDVFRTLISAAVLGICVMLLPKGFLSSLRESASASSVAEKVSIPAPAREPRTPSRFTFCGGSTMTDCVVDGDTFRFRGDKIRIADIDTPELHPPRCPYEKALGEAAKQRLLELLNGAPFDLKPIDRDTDRYGRKLRIVMRAGHSLGDTLVAEGLARTWEGRRRSWCD
jgi:endonuclease YncB( thermonuclease family)